MTALDRPPLEMQRFWQGQTLRSRDLNDLLAHDAQRRWWHNRALHNAFGVIYGLEVEGPHKPSRSAEGPRTFRVMAGLAYDCHGREIYLSKPAEVKVPPLRDRPTEWTLLIRYAGRTGSEFGVPANDGLGLAQPQLHWVESSRVELSDGVPLARGTVADTTRSAQNAAQANVVVERVPRAHSLGAIARARIQSGATIPGKTAWKWWQIKLPDEIQAGGLEAEIDTSAACFASVPCYFAWVNTGPLPPIKVLLSTVRADQLFSIFYGRISESTATSFRLSLTLSFGVRGGPVEPQHVVELFRGIRQQKHQREAILPETLPQLGLHIGWLGIEMESHLNSVRKDDHECH